MNCTRKPCPRGKVADFITGFVLVVVGAGPFAADAR